MKKTILFSLLSASILMAENHTVLDNNFNMESSLAVLGGVVKGENSYAHTEVLYGLEFGFNCLANDAVRQNLQITNYKDKNLKMTQINLNPHYMIKVNNDMQIGFGPTFGLARVDNSNDKDNIFTYGLGGSLVQNLNEILFVATEAKYEWTQNATLLGVKDNFNNVKVLVKAGYRF
jgi:hypothetical protein